MRHGSLFSGIGGFELAAEWMGWDNIFHCEMNTFGATNSTRNIIFRDTDGIVQSKGGKIQSGDQGAQPTGIRRPNSWEKFPTQSPVCSGDDGIPARLDGITFPKWRNESIKAYGNAIVPQVAYEIFRTIEVFEQQLGAPQA